MQASRTSFKTPPSTPGSKSEKQDDGGKNRNLVSDKNLCPWQKETQVPETAATKAQITHINYGDVLIS